MHVSLLCLTQQHKLGFVHGRRQVNFPGQQQAKISSRSQAGLLGAAAPSNRYEGKNAIEEQGAGFFGNALIAICL